LEQGESTLCAENRRAAKLVGRERAPRAKTPAVAVLEMGWRPIMTRAKVRSTPANNKAFNVKLS
jgi:hypothetical protein